MGERFFAEKAQEEGYVKIFKEDTPLGVFHADTVLEDGKILFEKLGITDQRTQLEIRDVARSVKASTEERKRKKTKEKEAGYLIWNNRPVELIFNPEENRLDFIYFDNEDRLIQTKTIEIDGTIYIAPKTDLIKLGAVIVPQGVQEYESEEKLIQEVREFIHRYVDISQDFELFATYYVLLTYVYDRFNSIAYLRFLGDFGTGKSRCLDVIGKLCYRPIVLAGTVTPAPLYRLQGLFRGTLLIDEADLKSSDATNDIIKILTCGFEKGKPVLRCDKNNPNAIEAFDPFGPKLIATRNMFIDQAIESRCLTEETRETSRKDIPVVLPSSFYEEQEQLRQKLLMFRLKNWNKIEPDKALDFNLDALERRLRQGTIAFASFFANMPELLEKFKTFLLDYQEKLIEEREETLDGKIVNYIRGRIEGQQTLKGINITASEIANSLESGNVNARTIGRHLRSLGLKTELKRTEEDNRPKRVIVLDMSLLHKLFAKYSVEYWRKTKKEKVVSISAEKIEAAFSYLSKLAEPVTSCNMSNVCNNYIGGTAYTSGEQVVELASEKSENKAIAEKSEKIRVA